MKNKLQAALILLLLLSGISMLLYPTVAQWWNAKTQSEIIADYTETVDSLEQQRLDALWQEAVAYNRIPTGCLILPEGEEQTYLDTLDVTGTGIMGYLTIPKIDVNLPIYHGTEDAVLQVGVGHLSGTSLPVGGKGTHCVLNGHRGLPSARLFTDLPQLEPGDRFTLEILGNTLTYQVDQILTVDPEDTEALEPDPELDLCTLVTCTPYGINSQRLLVRGVRVEDPEPQTEPQTESQTEPQEEASAVKTWIWLIPILLLLLFLGCMIRKRWSHET